MEIQDFIQRYRNHPVLFLGTGISLRYLEKSFRWEELLMSIANEVSDSEEYFLDLKSKYFNNGSINYEKIGTDLEKKFNEVAENDRNGKFKSVNDKFYSFMKDNKSYSRFKIFISELFENYSIREEVKSEIDCFKKIRKNIASIITTNYDQFIEDFFEFSPLIGNDILLSNPYGSVYKIHGCVSNIGNIILTEDDYKKFDKEYELIRAQLLSLFIHNPIIFIGYSIEDKNIRKILNTIFSYVDYKSDIAERIKSNFLLVEYESGSTNTMITEYVININERIIKINQLKTDSFNILYNAISNLHLPISAMDIRKVREIVKDIYSGGDIKVSITEDLNNLKNCDKVLVIGSSKTIKYEFQTAKEIISSYFDIIEEDNKQRLSLIDKLTINKNKYFPIFAFYKINSGIKKFKQLSENQISNIDRSVKSMKPAAQNTHKNIEDIVSDTNISTSYKNNAILWGVMKDNLSLDDMKDYLLKFKDKASSDYNRLLCAYDLKKYKEE
ncbi:MAG: SIR2 family protein [Magnetococcales bacterium]|nr:SIR2 family protein [Magnetococcales bacterium]